MAERTARLQDFLARAGWGGAGAAALAGDASARRYLRLRDGARTAVLMDAEPASGEDVAAFVRIARHLAGLGFSAPQVLAADPGQGFLLLEDLGDALFARVLEREPALHDGLYATATDVLIDLHDHPPPPGLGAYDAPRMADLAALALDFYGNSNGTGRAAFCAALAPLLDRHARPTDVLVHRDYHAENLLWLPQRSGVARVGLLDFQDALCGHRAYDLVSLLQDARRDVPAATETAMVARYVARTGQDRAAFDAAYHLLGAQRNLRILGVFSRLCRRDGRPRYIALIPRVWGYLLRDLQHPVLAGLAPMIRDALPEPTPACLDDLRRRCAPIPTP